MPDPKQVVASFKKTAQSEPPTVGELTEKIFQVLSGETEIYRDMGLTVRDMNYGIGEGSMILKTQPGEAQSAGFRVIVKKEGA